MSKLRYRITMRDPEQENWVVDGPGGPVSGNGTPRDIVMQLHTKLDEPFDIDATKMWLDEQETAAQGEAAKLPLTERYQLEVITRESF